MTYDESYAPIAPPQSLEDEQSVLGAVLLADSILPTLLVDVGLRGDHFYRESHGAIWDAMTALYDRGDPVDSLTVIAELKRRGTFEYVGGAAAVELLAGSVPAVGNHRAYAGRVRELAILRQKLHASYAIQAACHQEDQDALAEAEGMLVVEEAAEGRTKTAEQLGNDLFEFLQSGGGDRWSLPWAKLSRALVGGLRRGTVTLLIGHSSHGKSAAADDIVDTIVGRYDVNAHVYINEMTAQERAVRYAARATGIDLARLMQPDKADFTPDEAKQLMQACQSIPWGVTDAAGWTADDIARHMIRNRWDVTLVDIFQLIETGQGETRNLDRASRVLNAAAKRANTALILTSHVNEARSSGQARRPLPVLGDIRGTGQLKNDADNVLVVYREQSDDGAEVLNHGQIYVAKARGGVPGVRQFVDFDERRARFVASDGPPPSADDAYEGWSN